MTRLQLRSLNHLLKTLNDMFQFNLNALGKAARTLSWVALAWAGTAAGQTSVDIDLRANPAGDSLRVYVRPNGASFNQIMSAMTFTIRWEAASNATLGFRTQFCAAAFSIVESPDGEIDNGGFTYLSYNAFGASALAAECSPPGWTANAWNLIMRVYIDTPPTTCTNFNIVSDTYTGANNKNYFISLNGTDKTGAIDATVAQVGPCSVDCLGVVGGTALPGTACNDNNACTVNDVYTGTAPNCGCAGTPVPGPTINTSGSNAPICAGSTLNLNASATGTGTITYSWTGPNLFTSNAQNPTIVGATTLATGTYTVTASNGCGTPAQTTVNVVVNAPANAGTNGTITLCSNGAAVNLFSSLGGTPQAGGTWSPAGLTGGSLGTFSPGTNTAGVYTYTRTGVAPCANSTATVTVTVNPAANAGGNGSITVCNSGASFDMFPFLSGTPQGGGAWTAPGNSPHASTYDPVADAPGVYTYTVLGAAPCGNASAALTVSETANANAGTNGTLSICSNAAPADLFSHLGGSPQATGTWSAPGGGAHSGVYDPAVDGPGVYTYSVAGAPPCGSASATVTVTETVAANAGTNGTITLCSNGAAV
ncbi:MAG: immunoglobulin domain-containing protein, partial [Flavobacteriales bacterium]